MDTSKKHKMLWGLVLILIGLDVWQLFGRVNLEQQVSRMQVNTIQKDGLLSDFAQNIRYTPPEAVTANDSKRPLELIAVFTDYGCVHCAQAEIRHLNNWRKRFPGTIQVYFTGASRQYMKDFGAEFSFKKIKSTRNLFNISLPIGNPLIVLVDHNNEVQAVHTNNTSRPGSDQRRNVFYERMKSLFSAVVGMK
jgi:hypothetical protein